jgi:hypothetical protein
MAHSEAEAREKWCPYANQPGYGDRNVPASQCCVGSNCMMWRWVDPARRIKDEKKYPFGPSRNLSLALAPDSEREDTPNRRGRCGLAGEIS